MREREEIAIDIDPGKTLIVSMQGTAPAEEEGLVRVFFELNGQPRTMRIEKAGAARASARAEAESATRRVPAPMPRHDRHGRSEGGASGARGDPLVSIEAMKMETQIRAERDGTVRAVHVKPGETVAAHDLLLEY